MQIRSQDRKSLINMSYQSSYIAARKDKYAICTDKGHELGIYSTEEKALKVLDMIENYTDELKEVTRLVGVDVAQILGYYIKQTTFKMPQDDEVEL